MAKTAAANHSWLRWFCTLLWAVAILGIIPTTRSDDAAKPASPAKAGSTLVPLNKNKTVLLDVQGGRLLLKTKVCLRAGVLEMLCCRKQSKEHESILSLDSRAYVVHTGLLALKARPGKPVQYTPKYQPPTGTVIDIFLQWKDTQGRLQRVDARTWVRHATRRYFVHKLTRYPDDLQLPEDSELKYDKKTQELYWYGPLSQKQRDDLLKLSRAKEYQSAIKRFHLQSQVRQMRAHWVFAGSGFSQDKETGEKYYQAEGGDVICVANFASALLDIATESSATGTGNLLFEAFEERIPPVGTDVTVELKPRKRPSTPAKKTNQNPRRVPDPDPSPANKPSRR